jgi:hypothetical protein
VEKKGESGYANVKSAHSEVFPVSCPVLKKYNNLTVVMAVGSVGNCVVQTSSYPRGCGQVRRPFDDLSKGGVVRLWAARPIVLAVHSLSIPPASPGTVHSLLLGMMPNEIATL